MKQGNKYPNERTVSAVYSEEKGNPFLEALPEPLGKEAFMEQMKSTLPAVGCRKEKSPQERRKYVSELTGWFYPLDYMYVLYDMFYRAISASCRTKTIAEDIRQLNTLYADFRTGRERSLPYSTQGYSGAVLGIPGIGKTSSIRRCLDTMPQVIVHTEYQGKKFYTKQISYLFVECPSDCSIKTLAFNIFSAIDRAIGSDYFVQITKMRSLAASAITTKLKIVCMNHHIGLIVIDEIQNAVITAARNRQSKPLIKFLVELTNETSAGICFCGTLEAEELFLSQEHLKRRTRGLRLLPMKYDVTYRKFIKELWEYQVTLQKAELTEKLMKQIYDLSGGIPAYIVRIFQEAQVQSILSGKEKLSYESIRDAVDLLGIEVPKCFSRGGTSISDFEVREVQAEETGAESEEACGMDAGMRAREDEGIPGTAGAVKAPDTAGISEIPCMTGKTKISEMGIMALDRQPAGQVKSRNPMCPEEPDRMHNEPVKRFYAVRRGRPEKERERTDLLFIWKKARAARQMADALDSYHMLERRCY